MLQLERPAAKNALGRQMLGEMQACLERVAVDGYIEWMAGCISHVTPTHQENPGTCRAEPGRGRVLCGCRLEGIPPTPSQLLVELTTMDDDRNEQR